MTEKSLRVLSSKGCRLPDNSAPTLTASQRTRSEITNMRMGYRIILCGFFFYFSNRNRFRKLPGSVQNFRARAIHTYRVVPPGYDRQTIWCALLAPAKLHCEGTVSVRLSCDVVDGIRIAIILFEKALRVINGHRPEPIHRYIFYGETIYSLSVILFGSSDNVAGGDFWISSPPNSCANQMFYGIHFSLFPE